jgi:hypothetical protein
VSRLSDSRAHAKAGENGGVDDEPEGSADEVGSLRNLCKLGVERLKLSFDEGEVSAGLIGLAECGVGARSPASGGRRNDLEEVAFECS